MNGFWAMSDRYIDPWDTKGSGGYSAQKLFNSSSILSAIGVNCHSGCPGVQNVAMILCNSCAVWFHVRQ